MKRNLLYSLRVLVLIILALPEQVFAQTEKESPTPVSVDCVQRHIETLASDEFAGRSGPTALKAAEYVAAQFEKLKLKPVFTEDSFLQPIPGPVDEAGLATTAGWNVTGCWTPAGAKFPDEYLIIAAHHDHLGSRKSGIYYGADDNASGVAMVIEVARSLILSDIKMDRSVLFVSFDLEEHLLFGSRWWTAHPPVPLENVKFVVVADMLGRSLGDLPIKSVFLCGAEHGLGVRNILSDIPFADSVKPVLLSDDFVGLRSDYGPFRDRRIPFLFTSTGQSRDYHTMEDIAAKIDFEQVAAISTGLARLLIAIGNKENAPEWIESPEIAPSEVKAILEICKQIDEHAQEWKLTSIQKFFVDQTRSRAERILSQKTITAEDQRWLTRTTQMLLFTVF
ncbi:M28 family peptidase [uncultured Rubinisphaera sp.]|uniref:M28 family peptidase n=1 Tax=uncultured Rubinisphaera sp. TaxID=1678686 RepID=UPI0030D6E8F0